MMKIQSAQDTLINIKSILAYATCFLLIFFSGTIDGLSQSDNENRWRIGILAGVNTTSVLGGGASGFQKLGITAGVIVHKPLSENSAFETGLTFFQKGTRSVANPEAGIFDSYRLSLNYLDLPVLYVFRLKKIEIEAGPSFGLLISQKEEVFEGPDPDSRSFNTFELAANAGLRWHAADNFLLGLRYHLALLPSQSVALGGVSTMRGRHNHGFVLWGAFLF